VLVIADLDARAETVDAFAVLVGQFDDLALELIPHRDAAAPMGARILPGIESLLGAPYGCLDV
jgi:hypothetical protein